MKTAPADQAQRNAAVYERSGNVIIDAGAGTGKTRTIVERVLEHLAPTQGGPAVPISRIAAVTFTRRAAGELRAASDGEVGLQASHAFDAFVVGPVVVVARGRGTCAARGRSAGGRLEPRFHDAAPATGAGAAAAGSVWPFVPG